MVEERARKEAREGRWKGCGRWEQPGEEGLARWGQALTDHGVWRTRALRLALKSRGVKEGADEALSAELEAG